MTVSVLSQMPNQMPYEPTERKTTFIKVLFQVITYPMLLQKLELKILSGSPLKKPLQTFGINEMLLFPSMQMWLG